jgi:hypothetical protein
MLGIDVSKATLACTLFDPQRRQPLWTRPVANTSQGVSRLLRQTPADSPWALEPTGRYSLLASGGHSRTASRSQRALSSAQEGPPLLAKHQQPCQDRPT